MASGWNPNKKLKPTKVGSMPKMSAEDLKTAIEKLNISQGELARRLGVRPETVWRWLKNRHPIPGPVVRLVISMLPKGTLGAAE